MDCFHYDWYIREKTKPKKERIRKIGTRSHQKTFDDLKKPRNLSLYVPMEVLLKTY